MNKRYDFQSNTFAQLRIIFIDMYVYVNISYKQCDL